MLVPISSALRPGAPCAAGRGEPARAVAVAWAQRGLAVFIEGELVLFAPDLSRAAGAAALPEEFPMHGAPTSPSAKVMVIPTPYGIVARGTKTRMLRAKELEGGYGELQGCTISDDGALVACVRGGRAFVGSWDAP
jgi:hypothetical protein